jgi:hypothetical protein
MKDRQDSVSITVEQLEWDGHDFWSIDVMTCHDRLLSKDFPSLVTTLKVSRGFVRIVFENNALAVVVSALLGNTML